MSNNEYPGRSGPGGVGDAMDTGNAEDRRSTKLFQIPLVLAKIVMLMRAADLVHLRSTSSLWNAFMAPEIRKRGVSAKCGSSSYSSTNPYPGHVDRNPSRGNFDVLANIIRRSPGFPFSSLRIYIRASQSRSWAWNLLETSPVRALFTAWSGQLTKLEINISNEGTDPQIHVNGLRALLFNETPSLSELKLGWSNARCENLSSEEMTTFRELPALKSLELSVAVRSAWNPFDTCPVTGYMTQLVQDLIRATTTLERLTMEYDIVTAVALDVMLQNPSTTLQNLDVGSEQGLEASTLTQLINLSPSRSRRDEPNNNCLRLSTFKGRLLVSSPASGPERYRQSGRLLSEFLQLQSSHLRTLSLDVGRIGKNRPYEGEFDVQVPQMNELKSLHLVTRNSAKVGWGSSCPCPNLKKLHLELNPFNIAALNQHLTLFSTAPITDLDLLGKDCEVDTSEMLDKLATLFPRLSHLAITVSQGLVREFWTKWPQIQQLHLVVIVADEGGDLDPEMTGIPPEQCTLLLEQLQAGQVDPFGIPNPKMWPGLQDLSRLRSFRLGSARLAHSAAIEHPIITVPMLKVNIGDVTGYYAFAKAGDAQPGDMAMATPLQAITVLGVTKTSADCTAAIQSRLGMAADVRIYNNWEMDCVNWLAW